MSHPKHPCQSNNSDFNSNKEIEEMANELKHNLLKNWSIERYWDGNMVICGEIYNDEKCRFRDGTFVRTSRLEFVDFKNHVAKTKNSVYNLEERSKR